MYTSTNDNDDGYYNNYTTLRTFKTAPSEPFSYLIPHSTNPSVPPTVPTTISNNNNTSKDDAPMLQSPSFTTSTKVTLSSRSEESRVD